MGTRKMDRATTIRPVAIEIQIVLPTKDMAGKSSSLFFSRVENGDLLIQLSYR